MIIDKEAKKIYAGNSCFHFKKRELDVSECDYDDRSCVLDAAIRNAQAENKSVTVWIWEDQFERDEGLGKSYDFFKFFKDTIEEMKESEAFSPEMLDSIFGRGGCAEIHIGDDAICHYENDEINFYNCIIKYLKSDFIEKTVFAIETHVGEKERMVHFFAYGYFSDSGNEKDHRFVEYTFFYVPLKRVLKEGMCLVEENDSDQYKQYIEDCTEEEMNAMYERYDNGKMPKLICEEELNESTPDGMYILIKEKEYEY